MKKVLEVSDFEDEVVRLRNSIIATQQEIAEYENALNEKRKMLICFHSAIQELQIILNKFDENVSVDSLYEEAIKKDK